MRFLTTFPNPAIYSKFDETDSNSFLFFGQNHSSEQVCTLPNMNIQINYLEPFDFLDLEGDGLLEIQNRLLLVVRRQSRLNRKSDGGPGYTIAFLKQLEEQLQFDAIFEGDLERIQQIESCIRALKAAIQELNSSDGNMKQIRLLLNPYDEELIQEIQNKIDEEEVLSSIERIFWAIYNTYETDIFEEATSQLRHAFATMMTITRMRDFAYSRNFNFGRVTPRTEEKKQNLHNYLIKFKRGLMSENGIPKTQRTRRNN